MNKEDIFDSFPGIENVIASDVAWAVSYLYSRVILHRDAKPGKIYWGSLAFMIPELIIEELSIASAGIDKLWQNKSCWGMDSLMTFFTMLNPGQFYPFQNDLKNFPNKVTSNMEAAFKQE